MGMYDRQKYPDTYGSKYHFTFVGCGGLGTWSAIALAMSGIAKSMTFIDDDTLEDTNLNRLPYTSDDIGKPKVMLLEQYINRIRPSIDTAGLFCRLEEGGDVGRNIRIPVGAYRYIIFTADNLEVNEFIKRYYEQAIANNRVIWAGAEYDEISIRTAPVMWHVEGAHYEDIWVGTAWGAAMAVVHTVLLRSEGKHPKRSVDWDCRYTRINAVDVKEELKTEIASRRELQRKYLKLKQKYDDLMDKNEEEKPCLQLGTCPTAG